MLDRKESLTSDLLLLLERRKEGLLRLSCVSNQEPQEASKYIPSTHAEADFFLSFFFFFDVFKCCRITARCFYGHCASGGVRKVADSCKLLSTAKHRQRAAAASALTGTQKKGLVPMGAFKGFGSSRVLTPEAAGSARVPSIPLQACAGV